MRYVLQIYPGCQGCCTPAGIIIYALTEEDMELWDTDKLPEREILYEGTAFPVIDPEVLKKRMEDLYGEYSDAAFACTEAVDECFQEAVWDNIEEGKRILAEGDQLVVPVEGKLLKWARRAARIKRTDAEREMRYTPGRGILRMKENGRLPVTVYERRQMARLYKRPSAVFYLRRVPFRWYIEALGWPRKKGE